MADVVRGEGEQLAADESAHPTTVRPKLLELCAVGYTVRYLLMPLCRALKDDFDVHIAASPGEHVPAIEAEGFRYHPIRIARNYNLIAHIRSVLQLRALMSREDYQVVHTHTPVASLIGRLAARLSRVPVVLYTAHGFYFHDGMRPGTRRFFVMLEKIAGRITDCIFTQSREDYQAAVDLRIAGRESVVHIGNGVDLGRFDPDRLGGERDKVREKLGIHPGQPVLCMVGRVVREKGYLELVRAFAKVVRRLPGTILVMVGGVLESAHDDVSAELEQSIASLGLSEHVRHLSFQEHVEHILAASDVFVLPSHREGMPRSVLEAMAMGLPVVATDIRGSREAVVDGATGTLVGVGDVDGLASAMTDLLADPERRAAYGARAKDIAREQFGESQAISRQTEVIRRLYLGTRAR